jgi:glycosyltransferase involved in cell wall biosynthesis
VLAVAPQTRFVLVGGYGCGEAIESAWLPPALWSQHDQIHFTGWLKPAQVAEWYAQADILVAPSWYEPFGMVILEGMLYGLPIVATNVGGPAAILEDGRTGLLVPPQAADQLAAALIRLVENPSLRQQIGATAAATVRQRWLWPQIVQQMITVYQQ